MLFGAKYDYNESALTPKFDCTNQRVRNVMSINPRLILSIGVKPCI